jgi:hypothetical protein
MYRAVMIFIVLTLCLGCTAGGSNFSPPRKEAEPEFFANKLANITYGAGLKFSEFNVILNAIRDKYPKAIINKANFTITQLSRITSNKKTYTRIVFEYRYKQMKTMHGDSIQKFAVWKNESSLQIFAKNQMWPL